MPAPSSFLCTGSVLISSLGDVLSLSPIIYGRLASQSSAPRCDETSRWASTVSPSLQVCTVVDANHLPASFRPRIDRVSHLGDGRVLYGPLPRHLWARHLDSTQQKLRGHTMREDDGAMRRCALHLRVWPLQDRVDIRRHACLHVALALSARAVRRRADVGLELPLRPLIVHARQDVVGVALGAWTPLPPTQTRSSRQMSQGDCQTRKLARTRKHARTRKCACTRARAVRARVHVLAAPTRLATAQATRPRP